MGGISQLFGLGGGASYSQPEAVQSTPAPSREAAVEPESEAVREDERRRIRSRRAMNGTLLTSPLGVGGSSTPKTSAKSLLGANM